MGKYHRKDFSGGWQPDVDSVNAPPHTLLRADNLRLDENGILSLRRGSAKQHTSAISTYNKLYTIHSCYLTPPTLSTKERHLARLVGCGDAVTGSPSDEGRVYWIDNAGGPVSLGITFPISTAPHFSGGYPHDSFDIHMIDTMNRVFMARGTVKKKWDGSTLSASVWENGSPTNVQNWGLKMTGNRPTISARNSDSIIVDNFATHTDWVVSEGGSVADAEGKDADAGGAIAVTPDSTTNRESVTKTYATAQDWRNWTGKKFEFVRKTVDNGVSYTDYTSEAGDGNPATHVVLSSLSTLANGDGLIVGAQHTKFNKISVDMDASVNSNASTLAAAYWNGSDWVNVSGLTDGTNNGGATFGQDGDITFTEPDDWKECAIDGVTAFFIRLTVSATLDASVLCDEITCGAVEYVTPDTLFDFYAYVTEPKTTRSITVYIDTDDGDFDDNYFSFKFAKGEEITTTLEPEEFFTQDFYEWWFEQYGQEITEDEESFLESREHAREAILRQMGLPTTQFVEFIPGSSEGWNHFSLALGKFKKIGAPNWATVKAIRFTLDADDVIRLDEATIIGGESSSITGEYRYRYVYVTEEVDANGNILYFTRSTPSSSSDVIRVKANSVEITIPADASRDSQVNEIWLYRIGGYLDDYYRVYRLRKDVAGTALGTGSYKIFDTLSDRRALILNDLLEPDNNPPPDDIMGVAGPYYSRLYCLTQQYLYPSKIRQPENFALGEALRVAEEGERAWWVAQAQGGLYVGTNKTIKRLDGTGAPQPDGTIDFRLRDTNVRPAPVSSAVAQEGNLLFYLAEDGWRSFNGVTSTPVYGKTSLLYSGHTRHGVSITPPGNLNSRYRAIIARGALWALTPTDVPGAPTDIFHLDLKTGDWSRFVMPWQMQSISREPDGDILVGVLGYVYKIDVGTQDDGSDISVTLWTKIDDDGQPDQRKDAYDFKARLDTGGANATAAFHKDGSGTQTTALTLASTGLGVDHQALSALGIFTQVQERITGSFSTFKLYDFTLQYRDRPEIREYYENRPESPSPRRRRFGGLTILADTIGANATVTPVLDDVDQTSQNINCDDAQVQKVFVNNVVGRDLWARIEKATGFEVYDVSPIIVEEFPEQTKGMGPPATAGYEGQKVISGIRMKACTLGVQRVFTVYLDGVAQTPTFNMTTDSDEPDTALFTFNTTKICTDIAVATDGLVEIYDWEPVVVEKLPERTQGKTAETTAGYEGQKVISGIRLKVCTFGSLVTFTVYLDGAAHGTTFDVTTGATEPDTVLFTFASTQVVTDLALSSNGLVRIYDWEPIVVEKLPEKTKGLTPKDNFGTEEQKVISGIRVKACTLGSLVTFTPYLDGSPAGETFNLTTDTNRPTTEVFNFTTPQTVTDLALHTNGIVQLYAWEPIVLYTIPSPKIVWDTGPIDLGIDDLVWIREIKIKANTNANLTVTPYFDDVAKSPYTVTAVAGKATVYHVPVGREYKGRVPRVRIVTTDNSEWSPYWLEFYFRGTGGRRQKKVFRVKP